MLHVGRALMSDTPNAYALRMRVLHGFGMSRVLSAHEPRAVRVRHGQHGDAGGFFRERTGLDTGAWQHAPVFHTRTTLMCGMCVACVWGLPITGSYHGRK
jgi:hypothetical protein